MTNSSNLSAGFSRRALLGGSSALGVLGLLGCASAPAAAKARVVVVGGGYGGATVAKYIRMFSDYAVEVVLIEPNAAFISCPISNLVIGGSKSMNDITHSYSGLSKAHGVTVVQDMATAIDPQKRVVTLARGAPLSYDKLVVSPGVELKMGQIAGLAAANASGQVLQAWKAGAETVALRKQLESMADGGVFAISIPRAPYRCPPGPYERACQVASYFQKHKPKSKVLILDANPDVTSKGALFKKVWANTYKGLVEYRGDHKVEAIDAATGTLKFEVQADVKANVLNVLPDMRAGAIAVQTGLNNQANGTWCGVNFLTFESTVAKNVYVLGDAVQSAPLMPKSGHMANSHAKVAAAAIVAALYDQPVNPLPVLNNTCYSFVDEKNVVHVASVHQYVDAEKTYKTVAGSGGVSHLDLKSEVTALEGHYAMNWAQNIWADTLA